MKYQLRNIRINRGVNSRGNYEWLQAELFNDAQPWANPNRLPRLISMIPEYIKFFKEKGDTNLKEIPEYQVKDSTGKVLLQVFEVTALPKPETIAEVLKEQNSALSDDEALNNAKSMLNNVISHVDHVRTVVQPLIGQWQPIYRRDTTVNGVTYPRGSVRVNNMGDPVPAVSSLRVTIMQFFDPDENNGVGAWKDVENPEDIANLVLERGYKRVQQQAAQPVSATSAGAGESASDSGEALTDAEKAEMQKRIAEMQAQLNS